MSLLPRFLVAATMAATMLGLSVPTMASAARAPQATSVGSAATEAQVVAASAGWHYYGDYLTSASCVGTGQHLVRGFPGYYSAYYCSEYYDTYMGRFNYLLYLYHIR
ncbi:MAG TPA: hypothetical protein VK453_27375 [Micromonosporaceae bacterium]|nr:hypothetical protein [Micromonosporaceae bacterium]